MAPPSHKVRVLPRRQQLQPQECEVGGFEQAHQPVDLRQWHEIERSRFRLSHSNAAIVLSA